MVLATFKIRWYALADNPNWSIAWLMSSKSEALILQSRSISLLVNALLGLLARDSCLALA